jgi:HD-like signal output (HDOD) protein
LRGYASEEGEGEMQADKEKEAFEERINHLPLIDENVLEIISLLDDAESDFEMIVGRLSPEVTAKFLSMANSAFYGVEVKSITHALRVLGFNAMRQSLVTSLLMDHFEKCSGMDTFRLDKYHAQAHFCAAVSRILGDILAYQKQADLVTVSLLHNLGKLIIAVYFGDEYNAINSLKEDENLPTSEAERRVLGKTHAEISCLVLKKFNIPDDLCEAIRYHDSKREDLPPIADPQLMLILRESSRIVDQLELADKLDTSRLLEEMSETVKEAQEVCREMQRQEIKEKGYEDFFGALLTKAGEMVERDLRWIFRERGHAVSEGEKSETRVESSKEDA